MPTLKDDQIAALAIHFFGLADATTAVAIVFPESGGRTDAVNRRSGATGLWQVMPPPVHPWATGDLKNPAYNAQAAARIKKDEGWRAWSVHNSGTYALYLPRAKAAVTRVIGSPPRYGMLLSQLGVPNNPKADFTPGFDVPSAGDLAKQVAGLLPNPFEPLIAPIQFFTNRGNWLRVAAFTAGGLLLLTVLAAYIGREAVQVIPAGKAANIAGKAVKSARVLKAAA